MAQRPKRLYITAPQFSDPYNQLINTPKQPGTDDALLTPLTSFIGPRTPIEGMTISRKESLAFLHPEKGYAPTLEGAGLVSETYIRRLQALSTADMMVAWRAQRLIPTPSYGDIGGEARTRLARWEQVAGSEIAFAAGRGIPTVVLSDELSIQWIPEWLVDKIDRLILATTVQEGISKLAAMTPSSCMSDYVILAESKFTSTCYGCRRQIKVGEPVAWASSRPRYHEVCFREIMLKKGYKHVTTDQILESITERLHQLEEENDQLREQLRQRQRHGP